MNGFKNKDISQEETLGEKLKATREGKKIDLGEVEKITKIQAKYLLALENGQYEILPSDVYTKNFLKVYSQVLGLESEPLFELYRQERKIYDDLYGKKRGLARPGPKVIVTPQLIKIFSIGLVVVVLLAYLGWGINKIISAPLLEVISPEDKLITSQEFVKVEGKTEKEVRVTINNQEVLSDKNGYFEKIIDLQRGVNMIKITAVKKHSKENVVYREVLVE